MITIKISQKSGIDLVEVMSDIEKSLVENTKKNHDSIQIVFDRCCFAVRSLSILMDLIKKYCHVCRLDFLSCTFFPDGTRGFGEDRFKVIPMMKLLGEGLSKSCVENLNIEDLPGNSTTSDSIPAEATIAFAKVLADNPFLKALTYVTGTRGTMELCKAIEKNSNLIYFCNPNIMSMPHHQTIQKREESRKAYSRLHILLSERVFRRKQNTVLVSFSIVKEGKQSTPKEEEFIELPMLPTQPNTKQKQGKK